MFQTGTPISGTPIGFLTTDNVSGSYCEFKRHSSVDSSWYDSQYSQIKFPFESDYEAFLLFTLAPHKYDIVPLGKIIHVSSPETEIMVRTNNILTSLSLIIIRMTIIQIWISLRDKDNNPVEKKKVNNLNYFVLNEVKYINQLFGIVL
jgi:hypothetical protein